MSEEVTIRVNLPDGADLDLIVQEICPPGYVLVGTLTIFGYTEGEPLGTRPASKDTIETLPSVEAGGDLKECSICLEEVGNGEVVKKMPCKHKFHPRCIDIWLGKRRSCPNCRYVMPDKDDNGLNRAERVEIHAYYVSFGDLVD